MEESEKRKERLKAMRMEAAQGVSADSKSAGPASHGLSNPLIESETSSTAPQQYSSPRFDYYTHPMSAFSANKRMNMSPQVPQGHQLTPQRPTYQDMNPPPALNSQRHTYQNMNPPPSYHSPPFNSPHQRMIHPTGAHYNQNPPRSPMGAPQGYPPNAWGGTGASGVNYSHSPNFTQGNYPNSGFGQGDSPYTSNYGQGRGRGYNNNNSPYGSGRGNQYPDSGRGRGRSFGNRMGGRREAGLHGSVSGEFQPEEYYFEKMVEDPWKFLCPVIWKGSEKSWMPKSVQSKKAKVSSEASHRSTSQRLAEYLASSFNESATEAAGQEPST